MAWDSDYRYEPNPLFEEVFQCHPFSKYKNPHLETGNKIIMPSSLLTRLLDLRLKCPFFFKILGSQSGKVSHCGVLEFEAEEGWVYMPEWMMKNLDIEEGGRVVVREAFLPKGRYVKLLPHDAAFLELTNPKAVLEFTMRGFSCLSTGDTIMIKHGETDFYIDVLQLIPLDAVSLIDTDCELEFEEPDQSGKQEVVSEVEEPDQSGRQVEEEGEVYWTSVGSGRRLDGAVITVGEGGSGCSAVVEEAKKVDGEEEGKDKFKPFTGRSRVLRGL